MLELKLGQAKKKKKLKKGRRGKKKKEGQEGCGKNNSLSVSSRKRNNDIDSLEVKLEKSKNYDIDCLTLLPTLICLPLAI